jgi:DNA processing protein
MSTLQALVALSFLPSTRWRVAADRLRGGDAAERILTELVTERLPDPVQAESRLLARAEVAIARAAGSDLLPVAWSSTRYPALLREIVDPPFVVWSRGVLAALDPPAVAIVGSRAPTPYGLAVAERLAADLCSRGVVIVSGLARGVDSAAHRGALLGGGATIAVLGCGADVIYPAEHAPLARDIRSAGLIVSELSPGTLPLPRFFPLRNRLISGLSRAVVVVEAGERSGSLITARCALEQGRDVLAVPGNVLTGRNRGAHALIRDGAKIVESADDILEELDLQPASRQDHPGGAADPVLGALLPGEPTDLDAIAERSGLSPARLLPRLLELELLGLVARVEGGRFMRS